MKHTRICPRCAASAGADTDGGEPVVIEDILIQVAGLSVPDPRDREKVVAGLANSGYLVTCVGGDAGIVEVFEFEDSQDGGD